MAVSNEQLASYLASNPNLSDAQIAAAMTEYGVTPAQLASVTGISEGDVVSRIAKTLTPGQNINLGGVWVQPVYEETGSGETLQQGQLKEVIVYNQNQQTGDPYQQYSPTGEYIKSGNFQNQGGFGSMLKSVATDLAPVLLAAAGGAGFGGLLGGAIAPTASAAVQGGIGGALIGGGGAALTGQNIVKGALLGGAGGYFEGANAVPGFGPQTDASFLATDAAQLARAGLSEAQIAQTLGAAGYASGPAANLAASMAINGLDVGTMTNQLNNLSTNTGLMSQTGSSADFLAADALRLQGQLGNNFAAIEQNLIASGVDPLIAADVSQQLAFNPGITQADLSTNLSKSFGNNIYDANMTTTTPTAATTNTTGLTDAQLNNLIKAGVGLLGTGAAVNAAGGGSNAALQAPTQGMPAYTPDYYQQLQQYYNSYLPQTPRDVVSPLQQWYSQAFSGGNMQQPQQQLGTSTGMMQGAPVTPQTTTGVTQVGPMASQPAGVTQAGPVSTGGLFTAGGGSSSSFMSPASDKAYIDWMLTQPNPLGQGTVADVYKAQGVNPYTDPRVVSQAREQNERAGRRVDMYGGVAGAPMEQIAPWQNPNWQAQQAAAQQALAERQRVQAAQDAASGVTVGGGAVAPDVNQWAQTEQGQAAGGINSVYNSINTFLAGNPSQEALQAAMRDFGVTPETLEAARAYSANNPQ